MFHSVTLQNISHSRDLMIISVLPAGANLVGSDLYNNLIRYFVQHLKGLKDVRRIENYCLKLDLTAASA